MSGIKVLSGSAVVAALLLVPAMPALAFDPPQRLQNEDGSEQTLPSDEVEVGFGDEEAAEAAPSSAEDAAVDLCALAAEREATVGGQRGRVNAIGQVRETGGGWEVEGVVETGRGVLGLFRDETLFTCFARKGRVESMRLDDGSEAG
ncbi:hypothetical protein [Sphingomonas cavernae]|uniref:Uncharacterized protein n=1 Tax=Sphingomonas cavernae TaxID=2320861 RepID=A0A418W7N2_9SPHN|nr:hypothetical protein [Sphingomonas cavernae]RJF86015.1 hypothetical protein D3876_19475 [Sphingomonas cavernae]